MIIPLEEAQEINKDLTEDDMLGFEIAIRELTNNNFQNNKVRFNVTAIIEPDTILVREKVRGLRLGDRVELNNSDYNESLHTVERLTDNTIKVADNQFLDEIKRGMIVTLVKYPADVKQGIKKLLKYDLQMGNKLGLKSETVARMSKTYYDVTSGENVEGYPTALFDFISKYRKMGWGS